MFQNSYEKLTDENKSNYIFNYEEIDKDISPWELHRKGDVWLLYITDKKLTFIPKYGIRGKYKIISLPIMNLLNINLHYSFFKSIPELRFVMAYKEKIKYSTFYTKNYGNLMREISEKKYYCYKNHLEGIDKKYRILRKVLKENAGFISERNWKKLHNSNLCFQISKNCPLCLEL